MSAKAKRTRTAVRPRHMRALEPGELVPAHATTGAVASSLSSSSGREISRQSQRMIALAGVIIATLIPLGLAAALILWG